MKKFSDLPLCRSQAPWNFWNPIIADRQKISLHRTLSAAFPNQGICEYQYWLRDYNGYLAVFGKESESPELIFFRFLPT